jgi:hypothetical protein
MKRHDEVPFVITGHDVLGEILRRDQRRRANAAIENARRPEYRRTHRAKLGDREQVESNLPTRQCGSHK